jgi:hypothetical protein
MPSDMCASLLGCPGLGTSLCSAQIDFTYVDRLSIHPYVNSGNALLDPLFQFFGGYADRRAKFGGRQALIADKVVDL